jgi:hypothetical protein
MKGDRRGGSASSGPGEPDRKGRLEADAPRGEDLPPILGSWNRLYAFVLLWLAAQIALYFAFTRYFD